MFEVKGVFPYERGFDIIVDDLLDPALDGRKVQHHALFVQGAAQLQVYDPALSYQPPLSVQAGAVDHSQLVDEQTGHGGCGFVDVGARSAGGPGLHGSGYTE